MAGVWMKGGNIVKHCGGIKADLFLERDQEEFQAKITKA
jgi:hypothetical protein